MIKTRNCQSSLVEIPKRTVEYNKPLKKYRTGRDWSFEVLGLTGRVAVPRTGGLGTGTIRNLVEGGIKGKPRADRQIFIQCVRLVSGRRIRGVVRLNETHENRRK